MESLFKQMLALYGDFAEKARQHREKVSLLQQNTERYEHSKVEEMIRKENNSFADYTKRQQAQAERAAQSIMQLAEQRNDDFDIGELDGLINYVCAARGRTDFKLIEKQLAAFRGCPQAIAAVLAVAQANECPATVVGTIKSYACNLDAVSADLARNVARVFQQLSDAGEAGRTLCNIAGKLGIDITSSIEDTEGAAYIFRKFAGLI